MHRGQHMKHKWQKRIYYVIGGKKLNDLVKSMNPIVLCLISTDQNSKIAFVATYPKTGRFRINSCLFPGVEKFFSYCQQLIFLST